jgi:imidazolonepropionase-like amidohydrolase
MAFRSIACRAAVGLLTAASCGCAAPSVPRSSDSARTAIKAASLVDPATATSMRDVVVLVDGSRVAEVLPAARFRRRSGDRLIDLGGATLLPGLIDAHVHLTIGGPARANAMAILRAGFTTVADLGAVSQRVLRVRDSIGLGAIDGPRVLAAGLWIGVKGGVCEFGGIGVAGGADAFRARVRENLTAGADLIKACVTGWPAVAWAFPDSAELSPETLAAMVDEAHRAGRRVVAHALSRRGVEVALEASVDGLAHAAYVDDALAARMRQRGMWMIPTLASLTSGDTTVVGRRLIDAVRQAYRAGVTLVFGTDGGVLPHGQNAKEAAALALADSVGAIRPGMVADIIAVDGDPLADVGVLAYPRFVMARGRVVRGER